MLNWSNVGKKFGLLSGRSAILDLALALKELHIRPINHTAVTTVDNSKIEVRSLRT